MKKTTPLNAQPSLRLFTGLGGMKGAPSTILEAPASQLESLLGGPSLIRLEGARNPPLLVSTLLHGDEISGWVAIQNVLKRWQNRPLPRTILVFVGNVAAAAQGLRYLEGQTDHNRIWNDRNCPEHELAVALLNQVRSTGIFASLDLHNNSGRNPHYACVAQTRPEDLHLARLFSRHVLHMPLPHSMFTVALSSIGPAITCEAGLSGDAEGILELERLIEGVLHLSEHPHASPPQHEFDLYQLKARICLNKSWEVQTTPEPETREHPNAHHVESSSHAQMILWEDLDRHNFSQTEDLTCIGQLRWPGLPPNELSGAIRQGKIPAPFELECPTQKAIRDNSQNPENSFISVPLFESFFHIDSGGWLYFHSQVVPAMLTPSACAIKMDCLCYALSTVKEADLCPQE